MHLILYHRSILDAVGVSTALTVVILLGAGYGFLRLLRDLAAGYYRWRSRHLSEEEVSRRLESEAFRQQHGR